MTDCDWKVTKQMQDHLTERENDQTAQTDVGAGQRLVRSSCWRWVEVLACNDGQRARHSCVCSGDGCPLDPRLSNLERLQRRSVPRG